MCARRLFAAALISSMSSAFAQTTYTYAEIEGRPLQLDFYPPLTAASPAPLIIWIHGGGWQNGDKASTGPSLRLRQDGFAVASINYRLTSQAGDWGSAPVVWPAQAHDIKAAVRWLHASADVLDVDPCAFVSWGSSAGGHLSAILGVSNEHEFLEGAVGEHLDESSSVNLAIDYYGPSDLLFMDLDVTDPPGAQFEHDAVDSPESKLLGSDNHGRSVAEIRAHLSDPNDPWPELKHLAWTAAPARLAQHAASNVPMFIAHGEADRTVATGQSDRLYNALIAAGSSAELLHVPEAGHGLPTSVADNDVEPWLRSQVPMLRHCACVWFGDRDCDGDRDLVDYVAMQRCFSDSNTILGPSCLQFDHDEDARISLDDLNAFVTQLLGPAGG